MESPVLFNWGLHQWCPGKLIYSATSIFVATGDKTEVSRSDSISRLGTPAAAG